jgi:hypothetical protein
MPVPATDSASPRDTASCAVFVMPELGAQAVGVKSEVNGTLSKAVSDQWDEDPAF